MDAIILAGGFAKRMWPLTKNKPKQLLDLAGKPMLDYVFDSLDNLDFERIIVSVNSFLYVLKKESTPYEESKTPPKTNNAG